MSTTQNLLNLKIHKLSKEQFNNLENPDSNALYLIPDDSAETFYVTAGQKAGTTLGEKATAEGTETIASGTYSHAEGYNTTAYGYGSHAEGGSNNNALQELEGLQLDKQTVDEYWDEQRDSDDGALFAMAFGALSHTAGLNCLALGDRAHAEGYATRATGTNAHSEGHLTSATNTDSHAEGHNTTASGQASHAEGHCTAARNENSHASGYYTQTNRPNQTVIGSYNVGKTSTFFEVGNGRSDSQRTNAFEVYEDGRAAIGKNPAENMDVATKEYVDSKIQINLSNNVLTITIAD